VTIAAALSVNVHVLRLLPPLEQAPDPIASRPLVTLSVMLVPAVNELVQGVHGVHGFTGSRGSDG